MHTPRPSSDRWLGAGLFLLAAGLAANTFLGPLFANLITYPFTETVYNETLGLEAISLVLVAPLAAIAAALVLRAHRVGPVLAIGPAGYTAYMLVQYVVGPQYATYQPSIGLHLGLLVLSFSVLLLAWHATGAESLPQLSRSWAIVAFGLAAFVVSRWLPVFTGMLSSEPVPAAAPDVTMYWSIFLLDLGVVVPAAVAAGMGVLLGSRWAAKALFGVVGWFALVPPSVTAMSTVKLLRHDPNAATGDTIVFALVTFVFWTIAAVLYQRLFRDDPLRRAGTARTQPTPTAIATH